MIKSLVTQARMATLRLLLVYATMVVMLVTTGQQAAAATSLQLQDGITLTFEGGQMDFTTGSGQLFDVTVEEYGDAILFAEQVEIAAEGTPGSDDWLIRDLRARNVELAEEMIFIGDLVVRELNMGAASNDEALNDISQIFGEGGFMRLRNVSVAEDDVLMTIDEMATEPFRFGALDDGTVVMARGGVTINGLSLMPMGSDAEYAEFLERLRARGVDALVMDMKLIAGTRIVGPELEVFYVMGGDMRGLGSFELDIEVGINSSLYAQLVPQLQDPDSSSTALLGMTSAAYLRSAGLVYHDTGIGDIILEVAAEEDGVATEDMRSMMRVMLAESIRSTFPENASWMLPPLDATLKAGGRLEIAMDPPSAVPLSSMIGFLMLPDLAIQQLGLDISHRPN